MRYKIFDKKHNIEISYEDLALSMAKAGSKIVYCDIEGIAKIDNYWYILDECGNWDYIDTKRYEIKRWG